MRQPGLHAAPGGGLVSAAAAILLYHVANPQLLVFDYDHWDFLQMALFVVVGLITAKLVRDARSCAGSR